MAKSGGKKKRVPKARADLLLVERGLAAHTNEALALILKKLVVADEGEIIVDKASTMLPLVQQHTLSCTCSSHAHAGRCGRHRLVRSNIYVGSFCSVCD